MESPEKKLEKLLSYPEHEAPNPDLASDAAKLTQELYGRKKRRGGRFWVKLGSICTACAAAIVLAVVLPIYCRPAPPPVAEEPPHRFLDDELVRENIEDVNAFLSGNQYSVHCFNVSGMQSYVYRVITTTQAVVIQQSFMNVANGNVDVIDFEVCLTNDEFSRHDQYVELNKIFSYQNLSIQYKTLSLNNRNTVYANFEYESHRYYLSISSISGQADLGYYMQLLLQ